MVIHDSAQSLHERTPPGDARAPQHKIGRLIGVRRIKSNLMLCDLKRALAKQTDEQRPLVILIGLEGEPYDAVSSLCGLPIGTVRSRLARGRKALRQLTDGTADETSPGLPRVDIGQDHGCRYRPRPWDPALSVSRAGCPVKSTRRRSSRA